jgi:hypothetical protein
MDEVDGMGEVDGMDAGAQMGKSGSFVPQDDGHWVPPDDGHWVPPDDGHLAPQDDGGGFPQCDSEDGPPPLPPLPKLELPQEYREARKKRNQAGRRKVAESGRLPNGRAPYGFWLVTKRDVMLGRRSLADLGKLQEDEEKAGIVRGIFRDYLKLRSVVEVAKELNSRRVPTSGGREWTGTGVVNLLRNTAYVGKYVWGDNEKCKVKNEKCKVGTAGAGGVVIPCPEVVEGRVFRLAQELLRNQEPGRQVRGEERQPLLLGDIARCAGCGGLLVAGSYQANKKTGLRGGKFYACKQCKPCAWNADSPRPEWSIYRSELVEKTAWDALAALLNKDDAPIVQEMLLSDRVNVTMASRRKLVRQAGMTPWVQCDPFEVWIGYQERREATYEERGFLAELLVMGVRELSERAQWAWMYLEGKEV